MAEVPAAFPPDVLEAACSVAEAAAEVPAAGNNPVPLAEDLVFSRGVLAFMACVASLFVWLVSPSSFHGVYRLLVCISMSPSSSFSWGVVFKFVFTAFVAFQVCFHGIRLLQLCSYGVSLQLSFNIHGPLCCFISFHGVCRLFVFLVDYTFFPLILLISGVS